MYVPPGLLGSKAVSASVLQPDKLMSRHPCFVPTHRSSALAPLRPSGLPVMSRTNRVDELAKPAARTMAPREWISLCASRSVFNVVFVHRASPINWASTKPTAPRHTSYTHPGHVRVLAVTPTHHCTVRFDVVPAQIELVKPGAGVECERLQHKVDSSNPEMVPSEAEHAELGTAAQQ